MDITERNTKGGKNYKKRKTNRERNIPKKEYSVNVEEGEGYYAIVRRILGGNQVEVTMNNGTIDVVTIPGRMRKGRRGCWIKQDAKILVNADKEILKIVRDTDKEAIIVRNVLNRATGGNSYFNGSDSSDDEDELVADNVQVLRTDVTPEPVRQEIAHPNVRAPEFESSSEDEDTSDEESSESDVNERFKSSKDKKKRFERQRKFTHEHDNFNIDDI
jgi:translation initiation factor IF-1